MKPPFNPLTLLLPGEVCWIMDRSFAYEVNTFLELRCLSYFDII